MSKNTLLTLVALAVLLAALVVVGPTLFASETRVAEEAVAEEQADLTLVFDPSKPLYLVAKDEVEGLRVTRDDDLQRPYWIEKGDRKAFPVERRLVIEDGGKAGLLQKVDLQVGQKRYDLSDYAEAGRVVVVFTAHDPGGP